MTKYEEWFYRHHPVDLPSGAGRRRQTPAIEEPNRGGGTRLGQHFVDQRLHKDDEMAGRNADRRFADQTARLVRREFVKSAAGAGGAEEGPAAHVIFYSQNTYTEHTDDAPTNARTTSTTLYNIPLL